MSTLTHDHNRTSIERKRAETDNKQLILDSPHSASNVLIERRVAGLEHGCVVLAPFYKKISWVDLARPQDRVYGNFDCGEYLVITPTLA